MEGWFHSRLITVQCESENCVWEGRGREFTKLPDARKAAQTHFEHTQHKARVEVVDSWLAPEAYEYLNQRR